MRFMHDTGRMMWGNSCKRGPMRTSYLEVKLQQAAKALEDAALQVTVMPLIEELSKGGNAHPDHDGLIRECGQVAYVHTRVQGLDIQHGMACHR